MFICRACLRKASVTLSQQSPLWFKLPNHFPTAASIQSILRTFATTTASQQIQTSHRTVDDSRLQRGIEQQRDRNRKLEWATKKELEYLSDSFKIAQHVRRTLDKGDFEAAAYLVRYASRNQQLVVSWNHLIDYQMENQRLYAAIKLHNEMKKRAQSPNAQTYTIIFRGLANSLHPKTAVAEAVRIYTTLLNGERLKPNTVHMNAVLECCGRAGDLEAMFSIVNTASEALRSPNNQTYTIILNALQHKAAPPRPDDPSAPSEEETQREIAVAIQRARAIWEEVVRQWKKGVVTVDEELVAAMGRVLVMGNTQDLEDILALVEQTMRIPRFDLETRAVPKVSNDAGKGGKDESGQNEKTGLQASFPKTPTAPLLYARPGGNVLSLLMIAIAKLRKPSLAPKYWEFLTRDGKIKPDRDNYHQYLRVLRNGSASARAAKLISTMPREPITGKTFRLGFSACIKDNINKDAFAHACLIMDRMKQCLRIPDALAMRMFLQAATGNYRPFQEQAKTDPASARIAWGRQLVTALDRLWEPFKLLSAGFQYPEKPSRSPEEQWGRERDSRAEMLRTARNMVGTMDKIMIENACGPEVLKVIKVRKNMLNNYISKYFDLANALDAKLEKKRGPREGKETACGRT